MTELCAVTPMGAPRAYPQGLTSPAEKKLDAEGSKCKHASKCDLPRVHSWLGELGQRKLQGVGGTELAQPEDQKQYRPFWG